MSWDNNCIEFCSSNAVFSYVFCFCRMILEKKYKQQCLYLHQSKVREFTVSMEWREKDEPVRKKSNHRKKDYSNFVYIYTLLRRKLINASWSN